MNKGQPPEPLDFFIWTVEDVGLWLEEINLGNYREIFKENGVNGEYLESMSMFTTEQILRFIRRCHMKWGDFITLCKELRRIKVACLKGEQKERFRELERMKEKRMGRELAEQLLSTHQSSPHRGPSSQPHPDPRRPPGDLSLSLGPNSQNQWTDPRAVRDQAWLSPSPNRPRESFEDPDVDTSLHL
ncbi:hypothetical protein SAY86_025221 [Trapa natans]|uniref:SAM domain-containing protein n=1 Tax=Trapa natans TaxID=22666 RepID=A0AAN7M7Q2_TRANT|nr:hypothetical protein SAY86_025221 [Trapa natans]